LLSRARLKHLRSLRLAKTRAAEGLLLLEGLNAIEEALHAGRIREILWNETIADTPRGRRLAQRARDATPPVTVTRLEEPDVERLAQTRSPAGAFALAEDPCMVLEPESWPGDALALVAAGVADPGNLGTLVRSAAAFGAAAFVTTPNTVDPTNPKVVRASAGAVYRVPVARAGAEWTAILRAADVHVAVADAAGRPVRSWLREQSPPASGNGRLRGRWALVVGNEPRGLDAATRAAAEVRLAVPLAERGGDRPAGLDSLNVAVAAGILLHEIAAAAGSLPS